MSQEFIGKINDALSNDGLIDHEEFLGIEEALFAGDGVVDGAEQESLLAFTYPAEFDEYYDAAASFENYTDFKKFQAAVDFGGYTVDRYISILADKGLISDERANTLKSISQTESTSSDTNIKNIVNIDSISFIDNELFLEVTILGESHYLNDVTHQALEAFLDDSMIPLPLLMDALNRFIKKEDVSDSEIISAKKVILLFSSWLTDTSELSTEDQNLIIEDLSASNAEFALITDDNWDSFIASDEPVHRLSQSTSLKIFGDTPNPEMENVLTDCASYLPIGTIQLMENVSIHLKKWSDFQKHYANIYPDRIETPPSLEDGGITLAQPDGSIKIIVFVEEDPHFTADTFIHEIQHAVETKLSQRVFGDVLAQHYDDILAEQAESPLDGFSKIYGATNENEWFAVAGTIMTLGSVGAEYDHGEASLMADDALSFYQQLDDFRKSDPVGFLLVYSLQQSLIRGDADPEKYLSFSVLDTAKHFVAENDGKLSKADLAKWDSRSFDFESDKKMVEDTAKELAELANSDFTEFIRAFIELSDKDLAQLKATQSFSTLANNVNQILLSVPEVSVGDNEGIVSDLLRLTEWTGLTESEAKINIVTDKGTSTLAQIRTRLQTAQ